MKYDHLDYNEMVTLVKRLMPPSRDEDYDFEINIAQDVVCITTHRFNKFPELFPEHRVRE